MKLSVCKKFKDWDIRRKKCVEFERNRAIHGGVIAISVFDLMTLNAV